MANQIQTYSFVCGLCGAEFSSRDRMTALTAVEFCENQGKRGAHRFSIGNVIRTFKVDMTGPGSLEENEITARVESLEWEPRTHKPVYRAKQLTGAVIEGDGIITILDNKVLGAER